jgi:hypothetical protein
MVQQAVALSHRSSAGIGRSLSLALAFRSEADSAGGPQGRSRPSQPQTLSPSEDWFNTALHTATLDVASERRTACRTATNG